MAPDPSKPIGQFRQDGTFIAEQSSGVQAKTDSTYGKIYSNPRNVYVGDANRDIHRIEIQPSNQRNISAGKHIHFQAVAFDQMGERIGVQHADWKVEGDIGQISREVFCSTKRR